MANLHLLPRAAPGPERPAPPCDNNQPPDREALLLALLLANADDQTCSALKDLKLTLPKQRFNAALELRRQLRNCENQAGRLKVISRCTRLRPGVWDLLAQTEQMKSMMQNPMELLLQRLPAAKGMMGLLNGMKGGMPSADMLKNLFSR